MERVVAVIPARMGSARFPGKPLAPLLGRPMIEHVVQRAKMYGALAEVYVATCDQEIKDVAEAFGTPSSRGSPRCQPPPPTDDTFSPVLPRLR